MRQRCFRLIIAILALLTPASGSAIELAHGVVHGATEAIAHAAAHDLHLAIDAPSDSDHESLHVASFPARLSHPAVDVAIPTPTVFWAQTPRNRAEYSPASLIEALPPPRFAARPRAPPAI